MDKQITEEMEIDLKCVPTNIALLIIQRDHYFAMFEAITARIEGAGDLTRAEAEFWDAQRRWIVEIIRNNVEMINLETEHGIAEIEAKQAHIEAKAKAAHLN